jgi:hypothetical protein
MTFLPLVQAVLAKADSQNGVREVGGQNQGPEVEAYQARCRARVGVDPWCACFVGWSGSEVAGESWPLPLTAGCAQLGAFARAHSALRDQPEFGAVFLIWSEHLQRFHHCGFVSMVGQGVPCATIEGNTNEDGSPEGIGVFARTRTFHPADRFIAWWALFHEGVA